MGEKTFTLTNNNKTRGQLNRQNYHRVKSHENKRTSRRVINCCSCSIRTSHHHFRFKFSFICPFQAKLFRVFQSVMNAPPSKHGEELRKLAVYMVRQFVVAAEKNPKIYAEMFFWKTIRECNDMENGYDAQQDHAGGGSKRAWTEEQEDELRRLFEENQANPENEKGNFIFHSNSWIMNKCCFRFFCSLRYKTTPLGIRWGEWQSAMVVLLDGWWLINRHNASYCTFLVVSNEGQLFSSFSIRSLCSSSRASRRVQSFSSVQTTRDVCCADGRDGTSSVTFELCH